MDNNDAIELKMQNEELRRAEILEPHQTRHIAKDGAVVNVSVVSTTLMNEIGQMYAIAATERLKELQGA
ncbi:MAG: hypothetical protein ACOYOS_01645 [Syntrophales bacterium]